MKNSAANLVRDLLPPVVSAGLVRLSHRWHGMGSHTFQGRYATLGDVPCGAVAYDDAALARRIVASRRPNLVAAMARVSVPKAMVDDNGRTILPLVAARYVSGSAPFSIVDFGGGLGVGLVSMLTHLPELPRILAAGNLHYVIVETPSMCAVVEEVFAGLIAPKFGSLVFWQIRSQLPVPADLPAPVAILNMASVLQYIDGWREMLAALVQLKPRQIILSETPVTEAETYARMQCNMPRRRLATWVFNRSELLGELRRHGYALRFQSRHDLPLRIADEPPGCPSAMLSFAFEQSDT